MTKRVAIVVIHGIGEQVPMETLSGFIDTVWTADASLVSAEKLHPDTGAKRTSNASWYKPDPRTRNFDLRLITTETYETQDKQRRRADFFEFYWAHRITGTQFDQVRAWIFGLMLRNPLSNVPPPLLPAWLMMWVLLLVGLAIAVITNRAFGGEAMVLAGVVYGFASSWLIGKLNAVVGDIVRYVDPSPRNIKTRQEIREDGVRLLETLMGVDEAGAFRASDYDRVIVVGHSLGTIVGYDILNHAFGRLNLKFDNAKLAASEQVHLTELEDLVRTAWTDGSPLDIEAYRAAQDRARRELNAAGHPWIVSDFVSIGSPLTHAEFLMARDHADLAALKLRRVYPTCPPQLEFDRQKKQHSFTYAAEKAFRGERLNVAGKRVPHHAAGFAFTRWTNIYSPLRLIIGGDIVSGPVCKAFGLAASAAARDEQGATSTICGIMEHAVLPSSHGETQDRKLRFLTHLKYWDMNTAHIPGKVARHVAVLRSALDLAEAVADPAPKDNPQ